MATTTVVVEYFNTALNSPVTSTLVGISPVLTVEDPAATNTVSQSTPVTALVLSTVTSVLFNGTSTITQTNSIPSQIGLIIHGPSISASNSSSPSSTPSSTSGSSSSSSISTKPTALPTHSSSPVAHSGFTSGDIAGAAVGCLVGGALIAGLLVWLIMSSRQKKKNRARGFATRETSSSGGSREKALPTAPAPIPIAAGGWEQHLPQSESDGTIRANVRALFDQIELHVENFYRDSAVSITPDIQSELAMVDSDYLPDSVVGLLPVTRTPTTLIKHCLAQLIISHITAGGEASMSFLPADFVALPLVIGNTRASSKPAFAQALSRWRVLSSYLRPRPKDDRAYLTQRDSNITAAASTFSTSFHPWASAEAGVDARRQHLVNIMKSAADTGILIFAQPSAFTYRWTVPEDGDRKRSSSRIVVLPGFVKVSDEHAKEVGGRGQELVAPVLGTL